MWSSVKSLTEQPQEMITRQAGLSRNPLKVERQMTAFIDQDPCPAESPVDVLMGSPANLIIAGVAFHIPIARESRASPVLAVEIQEDSRVLSRKSRVRASLLKGVYSLASTDE